MAAVQEEREGAFAGRSLRCDDHAAHLDRGGQAGQSYRVERVLAGGGGEPAGPARVDGAGGELGREFRRRRLGGAALPGGGSRVLVQPAARGADLEVGQPLRCARPGLVQR